MLSLTPNVNPSMECPKTAKEQEHSNKIAERKSMVDIAKVTLLLMALSHRFECKVGGVGAAMTG